MGPQDKIIQLFPSLNTLYRVKQSNFITGMRGQKNTALLHGTSGSKPRPCESTWQELLSFMPWLRARFWFGDKRLSLVRCTWSCCLPSNFKIKFYGNPSWNRHSQQKNGKVETTLVSEGL